MLDCVSLPELEVCFGSSVLQISNRLCFGDAGVMELGSAIVWDVDSQEGVDFSEPSPPGCGFHAISPVLPDFAGLEKYGLDAWEPNLGSAAMPVLPPEETRLVGAVAFHSLSFRSLSTLDYLLRTLWVCPTAACGRRPELRRLPQFRWSAAKCKAAPCPSPSFPEPHTSTPKRELFPSDSQETLDLGFWESTHPDAPVSNEIWQDGQGKESLTEEKTEKTEKKESENNPTKPAEEIAAPEGQTPLTQKLTDPKPKEATPSTEKAKKTHTPLPEGQKAASPEKTPTPLPKEQKATSPEKTPTPLPKEQKATSPEKTPTPLPKEQKAASLEKTPLPKQETKPPAKMAKSKSGQKPKVERKTQKEAEENQNADSKTKSKKAGAGEGGKTKMQKKPRGGQSKTNKREKTKGGRSRKVTTGRRSVKKTKQTWKKTEAHKQVHRLASKRWHDKWIQKGVPRASVAEVETEETRRAKQVKRKRETQKSPQEPIQAAHPLTQDNLFGFIFFCKL